MSDREKSQSETARRSSYDREELARAILAAVLLIGVIGGAFLWSSIKPQEKIEAVSILLVTPKPVAAGVQQEIVVEAVDKDGRIDLSRNDTVRISIDAVVAKIRDPTSSRRDWSKQVTIDLYEGVGRIRFFGPQTETVRLTGSWVKCKSSLDPHTVTFVLMRFRTESTEFPP